jgi:putative transposase
VRSFAQALMGAEADVACGAGYGERSDDRVNTRNCCRAPGVGYLGRVG